LGAPALQEAYYGPETIRAMVTALDEAWGLVGTDLDPSSPQLIEAVRLRLADSILAAAASDDRSVRTLRNAGLLAMAMQYRLWPDNFGTRAIMPERANNPRYWTAYAEETRAIAEQTKDHECKRMLSPSVGRRRSITDARTSAGRRVTWRIAWLPLQQLPV
jgi:hypothetical protein